MTKQFVPTLPNSPVQYLNSAGVFNPALIDPTQFTFFYDDFTGCVRTNVAGQPFTTGGMGLVWSLGGTGSFSLSLVTPDDSGCIGSALVSTGATNGNNTDMTACYLVTSLSQTPQMGPMNDKTFDVRWKVAISNTTSISVYFGFSDFAGGGLGIRYDTASADSTWTGYKQSGGVYTPQTITGAVLDTNYHTLRMRSVTPGTLLFSVDGGTEVSLSGFAVTTTMCPLGDLITNTNAVRSFKADYIWGWISISR